MKKILTLGALGMLASFGSYAQITMDGRITAAEIGAAPGKYQSIGQFTTLRGFGDWGLKEAFVGEDANFLYMFVNGSMERNGNSFQLYFDVPSQPGAPACVALTPTSQGAGNDTLTSFRNLQAAFEISVDAAVAIRYVNGAPQLELADYRNGGSLGSVLGAMTEDGTPFTPASLGGAATAAYKSSPDPDNKVTAVTNEGFELRIAKAAYSIVTGDQVNVFVAMSNGDGNYFSTDFIPQNPAATGANLAEAPDFCLDVDGLQRAAYVVGSGVLGTKKVDAASLNFSVAPNPVAGVNADVLFTLDRAQTGSVVVTDVLGRTVATLANGNLAAGQQRFSLKSANLPAGQYLVKLTVGNQVATRKVAVL